MKKKNVFNFEKNKKRALKTMVSDLCKSVQKMTVYKRCKLEFKRGETAKVYNLENGEKRIKNDLATVYFLSCDVKP